MGVDYRAKAYLGVKIDPDTFFFETVEVTEVVCAHPEGDDQKFCPVCGTPADGRTVVTQQKQLKPQFSSLADAFDPDEDWIDWDYIEVGGLSVVHVSDYCESLFYLLGGELGETGSSNGGDPIEEMSADYVTSRIKSVKKALKKFGITSEPQIILHLSC